MEQLATCRQNGITTRRADPRPPRDRDFVAKPGPAQISAISTHLGDVCSLEVPNMRRRECRLARSIAAGLLGAACSSAGATSQSIDLACRTDRAMASVEASLASRSSLGWIQLLLSCRTVSHGQQVISPPDFASARRCRGLDRSSESRNPRYRSPERDSPIANALHHAGCGRGSA